MNSLNGKIAVVTGGGRGIGAATAKLLAEHGATVIIVSRTMQELESVVKEASKGSIIPMQADISKKDELDHVFLEIQNQWGSLDILVNCAGICQLKAFVDTTLEDWDYTFKVNVIGSIICCQHAFKLMKNGGSIINISSLAGIQTTEKFSGFSAYVTSKFAICGLTEALATEGKSLKIRVNAVAPGAVETRLQKEVAPFLKTSTQPSDVAKLIYFLADEKQSGKISGTIIPIFSNE